MTTTFGTILTSAHNLGGTTSDPVSTTVTVEVPSRGAAKVISWNGYDVAPVDAHRRKIELLSLAVLSDEQRSAVSVALKIAGWTVV